MKRIVRIPRVLVAVIVGVGLLVPQAVGQVAHEEAAAKDPVSVQRDQATGIVRVKIAARHGRLAWSDVLKALMRIGQLNDEALKHKLPSGKLDLKRTSSRFVILGINAALGPDIRMQVASADTDIADMYLLVTIDAKALRDKRRQSGRKLRETMMSRKAGENGGSFGLKLPDAWQQASHDKPLVIVVHGFNSSPRRFKPLVRAFQSDGFPSGIFSYPDDQPIGDSAQQLSAALKQLALDHPDRKVSLVTHSMGGLVARAVVEASELDPGNVTKLIMIAPPNHGSLLANFAFGLDILDHAFPKPQRGDISRFYLAVADGFQEAAVDLKPGSQFLRKLNGRRRNPNVRYSIFLGSGGRFTQERLDYLREKLRAAEQASDVAGLFTRRLDTILADLDEVLVGKGDGAVAIKRGRLKGVDDTVVLNFTHLGALQKEDQLAGHKLYEAVLDRLRR